MGSYSYPPTLVSAAVFAGLALLPVVARAQQDTQNNQPPPFKLRSETNAVPIDVSVRDSKGKPVQGLTRENFKISDEGKPRPIEIFTANGASGASSGGTAPLAMAAVKSLPVDVFSNRNTAPVIASHSTVILLDGVNGWVENFIWARQGVIGLLDKVEPDERIAVYAVTRFLGLVILQDHTSDHDMLLRNVAEYVAPGLGVAPPGMENMALAMRDVPGAVPKRDPQRPRDPTKSPEKEKQYMLRQASEDLRGAFQVLAARLSAIPGRKSIFWLTQGFPPSELRGLGQTAWDKTFTALNQADVAVNAVDSNGLAGPQRLWGPGAILTMQQIAERTGGKAYFHRNDLDGALAAEIAAARESYTLGFYLANQERDGKFHRLTVSTDRPRLELQYRQGYYAGTDRQPDSSPSKPPLETALLSPMDSPDVGITANIVAASGNPQGTLRVRLNIDMATLTIEQRGTMCAGKIDEMFVQMNKSGQQLAKISDTREFQFPEASRPQFTRQGVLLEQTMPLMEGVSRLSIVIRDAATGQLGTLTVPLDKLAGVRGQ